MPSERWLRAALWAVLLGYALLFLGVVGARFGYPYELEWMEGGMLAHALRVLSPEPLYAKPSLEFVAYMYPPLYYYASAGLVAVLGEGFGPLRGLSVLAALGCFGLLYRIVERESRSRLAGALAAGSFVASYQATGAWLDLARQDSLYLFCFLLAIERLRAGGAERSGATGTARSNATATAIQSGLALAAAFFVKQSIVVVALPVWCALWLADRSRASVAALAAGAPILIGVAALDGVYDGWYWYYTVAVPSGHPSEAGLALAFWTQDLLPVFGIALAASAIHQWRRTRSDLAKGRLDWFWPALLIGALGSSWSVRSLVGAHVNNLFPVYAVLCLTGGLAFAAAREANDRLGRGALLAALAQLALLAYDPRPLVPTAADRAAGDALVATLAALPGEVFIPNHGYLARRAGKREYAHTLAIDNLLLDDPSSDARRELELDFLGHFQRRAFGAVVIESDGRYGEFAQRFYGAGEPLFERKDVFFAVSGGRIRPETLYQAP